VRCKLEDERFLSLILCAPSLGAQIFVLAIPLRAQSMGADWEEAAGGKQQFEVASVREDKVAGRSSSSYSLDNGNACFNVSKDDALAPKIGHKIW
jgi:hypothetical protein